jgi:diguanylate cyclase
MSDFKLESVRSILTRLTKEISQIESRYQQVIESLNEMESKAEIDDLTGLLRRAAFEKRWKKLLIESKEANLNCGILVIDIDHFKKINDQYGHAVGDDALRALSSLLKKNSNEKMLIGRFGGEEFVIALQEREAKLVQLAEIVRHSVSYLHLDFEENHALHYHPMSVSLGMAFTSQKGYDPGALFLFADEALYLAKQQGRNCLKVA